MKYGIILMLGSLLIFAGVETLAAQTDPPDKSLEQGYKERYTRELFDQADTNGDGYVSWSEARESALAIERDRAGRKRFAAADMNNDGRLSIMEAKKYKAFEVKHWQGATRKIKDEKIRKRGDAVFESPARGEQIRSRQQIREEERLRKRDDTVLESDTQGEEIRIRQQKREERISEKHPQRKERIRERKINTRRIRGDR